jgi:hypothetical protein
MLCASGTVIIEQAHDLLDYLIAVGTIGAALAAGAAAWAAHRQVRLMARELHLTTQRQLVVKVTAITSPAPNASGAEYEVRASVMNAGLVAVTVNGKIDVSVTTLLKRALGVLASPRIVLTSTLTCPTLLIPAIESSLREEDAKHGASDGPGDAKYRDHQKYPEWRARHSQILSCLAEECPAVRTERLDPAVAEPPRIDRYERPQTAPRRHLAVTKPARMFALLFASARDAAFKDGHMQAFCRHA